MPRGKRIAIIAGIGFLAGLGVLIWLQTTRCSRALERLTAGTSEERAKAAESLLFCSRDFKKAHLSDFVLASKDQMSAVRTMSIWAMDLGADALPALPRLVELLDDPAHAVRESAVLALARMGKASREAESHLAGLIQTEDRRMQYLSAIALSRIDPENPRALAVLERGLAENHDYWPYLCAAALVKTNVDFYERALSVVLRGTESSIADRRANATQSLKAFRNNDTRGGGPPILTRASRARN